MKKLSLLTVFALAFVVFGFNSNAYAQSSPVLYFCEQYGSYGEVGISDRFTSGFLTVMVKADDPMGLSDVSIQFDKYNPSSKSFSYYKKFPYTVSPDMNYIYFAGDDLSFDTPGIYRVFLLDNNDRTVASALIEII